MQRHSPDVRHLLKARLELLDGDLQRHRLNVQRGIPAEGSAGVRSAILWLSLWEYPILQVPKDPKVRDHHWKIQTSLR